MNLDDITAFRRSLDLMYGADTVRQAQRLLDRSERFIGLEPLGADMQGSAMHQTLLVAYDKLFA
jgi:ribosomal protein S12 methylthiotransferase accessory factor